MKIKLKENILKNHCFFKEHRCGVILKKCYLMDWDFAEISLIHRAGGSVGDTDELTISSY